MREHPWHDFMMQAIVTLYTSQSYINLLSYISKIDIIYKIDK